MSERCTATSLGRCEREAGHLLANEPLQLRYHASGDRCWIRHGAYDLAWSRCAARDGGYRCTNLARHGVGSSECDGRQHRWALVHEQQLQRDAQDADARDLLYSLGAP